jgi:hypothetical protein
MSSRYAFILMVVLLLLIIATYILPNNRSGSSRQIPDCSFFDSLLQQQSEAWNKGDLTAFMMYYLQSDQLYYATAKKNSRGWQSLYDSYHSHYWQKEEVRGQLTFTTQECIPMDKRSELFMVPGEWSLARFGDTLGGKFNLIFRDEGASGWKIIVDNTW